MDFFSSLVADLLLLAPWAFGLLVTGAIAGGVLFGHVGFLAGAVLGLIVGVAFDAGRSARLARYRFPVAILALLIVVAAVVHTVRGLKL